MKRPRGRPPDGQHRRIRLILGTLTKAGPMGAGTHELIRAAEITGQDPRRVLLRDLRNLRKAGWSIESVNRTTGPVYVLRVIDPRIRRVFTASERRQLLRAAESAGLGQLYEDLEPGRPDGTAAEVDDTLGLLQEAITARCLVRFRYQHKPREAHPYVLTRRDKGWVLRARETTVETTKTFYIRQIEDLDVDSPGTAEPVPLNLPRLNLDPMQWAVHEPTTAVLEIVEGDQDEVIRQFGTSNVRLLENGHLEVTVSNTEGFLARLFELGTRVRLVSPRPMREAAARKLRAVVEADA